MKAAFSLVLVAVFWGIGFPVMKAAIEQYDVFTVLWLRFALAATILAPFAWYYRKLFSTKSLYHGLFLGLLLFLTFAFFIAGLSQTTSTNTGFLSALAIVWVPLLNKFVFRKALGKKALLAIVFALFGITLLSSPQGLGHIDRSDLLVITGSVFSALHIMTIDKISAQSDSFILTLLQLLTVSVCALFVCYFVNGQIWPSTWNSDLLNSVLITAVLTTALAFWLQAKYQHEVSAETAVLIYNTEPIFAVIFSVCLLEEQLNKHIWFGGLFILLSVFIISIRNKAKEIIT